MPPKLDPNATVAIPCPQCGAKIPQTVAQLELAPRIRCTECGVLLKVDARKILQRVKEAQAKAEADQRFGR